MVDGLCGVEAEIDDCDVRESLRIEIAVDADFLHTEPDLPMAQIEVGLDHPPMSVHAALAEHVRVRLQAAIPVGRQRRLRLADQLVDEVAASAKADATGRSLLLYEFGVAGWMFVHGCKSDVIPDRNRGSA